VRRATHPRIHNHRIGFGRVERALLASSRFVDAIELVAEHALEPFADIVAMRGDAAGGNRTGDADIRRRPRECLLQLRKLARQDGIVDARMLLLVRECHAMAAAAALQLAREIDAALAKLDVDPDLADADAGRLAVVDDRVFQAHRAAQLRLVEPERVLVLAEALARHPPQLGHRPRFEHRRRRRESQPQRRLRHRRAAGLRGPGRCYRNERDRKEKDGVHAEGPEGTA
jgi:hypothetical protein